MQEKTYQTECGVIHYWVNTFSERTEAELIFLPGLTADHRLFEMLFPAYSVSDCTGQNRATLHYTLFTAKNL